MNWRGLLELNSRGLTTVAIVVVVVLLLVVALKGLSADVAASLLGVIVGAGAASAVQVWTQRDSRRQQMRMAAIDRRLQAHQEAFAHWRQMLADLHDEEKMGATVAECQTWWEQNCLYLEPGVSGAFLRAYWAAGDFLKLPREGYDPAQIMKNRMTIVDLGNKIREAVALPPIGEDEKEIMDKGTPSA